MYRIASLFLLQRLKGSMSGDTRDFNNMETWAVVFFFLQGMAPKEIHAILTGTLGEHAPSYATVKNWVAQFKRGDFSTCDAPRPERPKTMTTPEIIDQIPELIFEDCRISSKSIAEQQGISRAWIGSIIHEAVCEVGPEMPERGSKMSMVPVVWATFGMFLARSKRFPVANGDYGWNLVISLWSGNKPTINGVAYPASKYSECKNPLEKFSPQFFGIKTASSSLIIFQRAKLSTQSITDLCWCNWRTFWRKNAMGRSPKGSCSCTTMPRLTGHLQPRRNWPTWVSNVLITHPILRIWPRWTTTCSLDWKNNWMVAIFRLTQRSLLPRRPGWMDDLLNFFLSGLQKLEQRAKKCIELHGEYAE